MGKKINLTLSLATLNNDMEAMVVNDGSAVHVLICNTNDAQGVGISRALICLYENFGVKDGPCSHDVHYEVNTVKETKEFIEFLLNFIVDKDIGRIYLGPGEYGGFMGKLEYEFMAGLFRKLTLQDVSHKFRIGTWMKPEVTGEQCDVSNFLTTIENVNGSQEHDVDLNFSTISIFTEWVYSDEPPVIEKHIPDYMFSLEYGPDIAKKLLSEELLRLVTGTYILQRLIPHKKGSTS